MRKKARYSQIPCFSASSNLVESEGLFNKLLFLYHDVKLLRFTIKTFNITTKYFIFKIIFQTDAISQKFILWQFYFDFSQMLILTVGHLVFDQNAFGFIWGVEYSLICITDAEIWEPHSKMSFLAAFQAQSASRRQWQAVRLWKVGEAFVRFCF